jgi:hypothetical protein
MVGHLKSNVTPRVRPHRRCIENSGFAHMMKHILKGRLALMHPREAESFQSQAD